VFFALLAFDRGLVDTSQPPFAVFVPIHARDGRPLGLLQRTQVGESFGQAVLARGVDLGFRV
jgi:hypothetical protein